MLAPDILADLSVDGLSLRWRWKVAFLWFEDLCGFVDGVCRSWLRPKMKQGKRGPGGGDIRFVSAQKSLIQSKMCSMELTQQSLL